jgi:hypothetical protein
MSDEGKPVPQDRADEVKAMGMVAQAVAGLDAESIARVLRWAVDAYGVTAGTRADGSLSRSVGNGNGGMNEVGQFGNLSELYAATSPESESDKVLVAAYWAQFGEGKPEFTSQEINSALKNLGHPIKNITSAFDTLRARKPTPVMQLRKSGTSRQARKTFKLTIAGKSAVEALIHQG